MKIRPITTRQYLRLLASVALDFRHNYTIDGVYRRAVHRARVWWTRGRRDGREHARDLALQALSDAPLHLGYGRAEVLAFMDGDSRGYERLASAEQMRVVLLMKNLDDDLRACERECQGDDACLEQCRQPAHIAAANFSRKPVWIDEYRESSGGNA